MRKLLLALNPSALVLLLLLFTLPLHAQRTNAPSKVESNPWEPAIRAFELADKTNAPPKNAVLFVGSSSIRLWKTLTNDFAEFPVINRGFGGSTIADSVRYVERIVLPYQPKAIVFYAGDNDLAQKKDPEQVFKDFQRFVYKVHWAQPDVRIFFVSVKPSPSRWTYKDHVRKINSLVEAFSKTEKNLHYIDIFTPMLDSEGKPREELFIKDKLHLNHDGYALWTSLIKPRLLATLRAESTAGQ